jgi:hypothetical protein
VLRQITDVADFHFSDIPVRGDDGAGAIGMMMMRPLRRRRWTAISYGVFANARPRKISSLRASFASLAPISRARGGRRFQRALTQTDLLDLRGRCCGK